VAFDDVTGMRKATPMVGAALMVAAAGIAVSHGISDAEPAAHKVTYTVTTGSELTAQIYYLGTEPPSQAAFDADSSQYLTNVKVNVNPAAPWVFETTLNDPNQWAIVSASGLLRTNPAFHCEIAVDGVVVVTQYGGSGVQCALRPW
jgi:hypothetical protein